MASVDLRPGDTLNIIWSSTQETPLGETQVESSFAFSYEELLGKLKDKAKESKLNKKSNKGVKFSRFVSLSYNALNKGKWSTGASIDRNQVFEKLLYQIRSLESKEYQNITSNARSFLTELCKKRSILTVEQRRVLRHELIGFGWTIPE